MHFKAQSALEYLVTYGWAILAIVVVLAILIFALGGFSTGTVVGSACISPAGISCQNPILNTSNYLGFNVSALGATYAATGIACSTSKSEPPSSSFTSFSSALTVSATPVRVVVSCPSEAPPGENTTIGSSFTGYLWIKYNTATQSGLVDQFATVSVSASTSGPVGPLVQAGPGPYIYCVGGQTSQVTSFVGTVAANDDITWTTYPSDLPSGYGQLNGGCLINSGHIFCTSTQTSSPNANNIAFAPISGNTIGTWSYTANYFAGNTMSFSGCTAANGYIYCFGSLNQFQNLLPQDVIGAAPISSSGIPQGQWVANLYPSGHFLFGEMCFVNAGYIYCLGNYADGGSGYYAPVSGTSIGSWSPLPSYPGGQPFGTSCTVYQGYVYCVGGRNSASSTFSAQILSNGGLGAWTTQSSFPATEYQSECGVFNNQLMCFGSISGYTTVYNAPISDGTIGTWSTLPGSMPLAGESAACVEAGYSGSYTGQG